MNTEFSEKMRTSHSTKKEEKTTNIPKTTKHCGESTKLGPGYTQQFWSSNWRLATSDGRLVTKGHDAHSDFGLATGD